MTPVSTDLKPGKLYMLKAIPLTIPLTSEYKTFPVWNDMREIHDSEKISYRIHCDEPFMFLELSDGSVSNSFYMKVLSKGTIGYVWKSSFHEIVECKQ